MRAILTALFLTAAFFSIGHAEDCYSIDSSPDKWVQAIIQQDWADEALAELDGRDELYYYVEQGEEYYELEEEDIIDYTELESIPFDTKGIARIDALIGQLNAEIAIDLIRDDIRSEADFIIVSYYDDDSEVYGFASETEDGAEYVLAMQGSDDETPFFSNELEDANSDFLHELGHVLGLEHPFDGSDGDCIGSTEQFGEKTANISQTLMAYEFETEEEPRFYTKYDILALQAIYGEND